MGLSWSVEELKVRHTFTISRGSRDVIPVVIVRVDRDGITGFGEASPSARYGEDTGSVVRFLEKVDPSIVANPPANGDFFPRLDAIEPGNYAAKAAVDIAMHDWRSRAAGVPLWKYFGLDGGATPVSSFTIGMDTPEVIAAKVTEAEAYPVLKIKVGGPDDRETVLAVRRVTSKPLRVDANEGWIPGSQSVETALWLEEQGVELLEQPFPAGDLEAAARLREQIGIPLIADESFGRISDLGRLAGCYDGVNVKLMKCGGAGEAYRIMKEARKLEMKIQIGCMIETSVGISAAAHLSPMADYADLDGNLLISNDPFTGAGNTEGRIRLDDRPGLGVAPREVGV